MPDATEADKKAADKKAADKKAADKKAADHSPQPEAATMAKYLPIGTHGFVTGQDGKQVAAIINRHPNKNPRYMPFGKQKQRVREFEDCYGLTLFPTGQPSFEGEAIVASEGRECDSTGGWIPHFTKA